jgi:adenylate cyclase
LQSSACLIIKLHFGRKERQSFHTGHPIKQRRATLAQNLPEDSARPHIRIMHHGADPADLLPTGSALTEDDLALPPGRWLLERSTGILSMRALMRDLCHLLVAQGMPLQRASCFIRTLHPQANGRSVIWRKTMRDPEELMVLHGIEETESFKTSPLPVIFNGAGAIRRRLTDPTVPLDYPVLMDLKQQGATDYVAMPLKFSDGEINFVTWTTDTKDGFTTEQLSILDSLLPVLALRIEILERQKLTEELLQVYLGHDTGRRVLNGAIRRGSTETIRAAILYADVRGFTAASDALPGPEIISLLNDYFEVMSQSIEERGGEILKFIGDGLLAIFPLGPDSAEKDADSALKAAIEAQTLLRGRNTIRKKHGKPVIEHALGLHVGDVSYGNIGSPTRLDFTVIGPAVNLASRLQGLAKELGHPIVASDLIARMVKLPVKPLGRHPIRGLRNPVEIFAPYGVETVTA